MEPPPPAFPRPLLDRDDDSSDDSLLRAAASGKTTVESSGLIFPGNSLQSLRSSGPSSSVAPAGPSGNSFFAQSSSFLSTSSSSDDESDDFFGYPSSLQRRRSYAKPKTVRGTKTSFILGGKLGEGAYGIVKEGIDEQSLRIVAVKVLDLRRLRKLRGGMEGVEREVAVQKRLKRHVNLIELIDVVRQPAKNKMYIVLEMANGCTAHELADAVEGKRLPESQVANFTFQTLKGLQYMHGKGVVHRDIKPSNLILNVSGDLKISDFGVAEFLNEYNVDDQVSRTSGSPAFQAPEIATGVQGYSGMKVDVWALGVSVYLLLTGKIPFESDNLVALFDLIAKGEYEEPTSLNEGCRDVLRAMLTVDWEKRSSVDDLLKHPWVVRGGAELSEAQRIEKGWVPIPRKDFRILEVVKRMYNTEVETTAQEPSKLTSVPGLGSGEAPTAPQGRDSGRRPNAGQGRGPSEGGQGCSVA